MAIHETSGYSRNPPEIDCKARCQFLQSELESVLEKLLKTQQIALEAQREAIERGWKLIEANAKLAEKG